MRNLIKTCQGVPWIPVAVAAGYIGFVKRYRSPTPGRNAGMDEEEVRLLLRAWNFALMLFSIWGAWVTCPHLTTVYTLNACGPPPLLGEEGYAMGMFCMSKFAELIDTVFLAVRNRKISFLHSYHHASVLLKTWMLFVNTSSIGPVFVAMNYFVHMFLYAYYLASSFPKTAKAAKSVAPVVTSLQVVQMVFGIEVCFDALMRKAKGDVCLTSAWQIGIALCSYGVYLFLFSKLWIDLYVPSSAKKGAATKRTTAEKKAK